MVFHPQVITLSKSYTMPFYSGIKNNGLVIINSNTDLLSPEDRAFLEGINVSVYTFDGTALALEIGGTELSTNMAMIGAVAGITKVVTLEALDAAIQERFGKKYVASGGTASLDEAIKKKYAKKEQLLQKNMATIRKSYEMAAEWAKEQNVAVMAA
jgi:pyruvate ferredoxin oxidoreductase gamma subunit